MRIRTVFCVTALLLAVALLPAANRDFLTTDEADQIREAQDPNQRLLTYAEFARQRVDMILQFARDGKAGRTSMIHEALEDYVQIIEAIDTVADDALLRRADVTEGIQEVTKQQKEFLAQLQAFEDSEPADMERYRFVLDNAIFTTEDSIEVNQEDLGLRQAGVIAKDEDDQREIDSLMTPEMVKKRDAANAEKDKEEAEDKRKAPTLRRPGDKPPER